MTVLGRWVNVEGSELELVDVDGIVVRGTYTTRPGDPRSVGRPHPLVGTTVLDLVGFSVAWPDSRSLTSWTGRRVVALDRLLGREVETLRTVWHLARLGEPDKPAQPFETFLTNATVFYRPSDLNVATTPTP